MTWSIQEWLAGTWPSEARAIGKLSFVVSGPEIYVQEFPEGYTFRIVCLEVRVSMPAGGPTCDVKSIEPVWMTLLPDFPASVPDVYVRAGFPAVPHLSSRVEKRRKVCLTRRPTADWWFSKTLVDVTREVYDWLCDAAAGMLVKDDDPFEPLIASGGAPGRTECRRSPRSLPEGRRRMGNSVP